MVRQCSFLLSLALFAFVFAGCDATGGNTDEDVFILTTTNDDTQLDPITYTFRYDSGDVENDTVKVISDRNDDPKVPDNIDDLLGRNGFSRSDVESAKIEKAVLIRRSDKDSRSSTPKVFDYLSGGSADVFLGTSASGTRFAEKQLQSTDRQINLDIVGDGDVTSAVKSDVRILRAFLQLETSGEVSQEDVVEVKVSYRIRVRGT